MNLAHDDRLRELISKRMTEVFGTQASLIRDAGERKMVLSKTRLSKYFGNKEGGICDEQVLWIATRLGIFIHINFGNPVLKNGKLFYEVPKYDELASLQRIKQIFK